MLKISKPNIITKFESTEHGHIPDTFLNAYKIGLYELIHKINKSAYIFICYVSHRWRNGNISHRFKISKVGNSIILNIANIENDIKFRVLENCTSNVARKMIYQWTDLSKSVILSILMSKETNIGYIMQNYTIDHSKYIDIYEQFIHQSPRLICYLPKRLHTEVLIKSVLYNNISLFPYVAAKLQTKEDATRYIQYIINNSHYYRDWKLDICARLKKDQDIILMDKLR